jgi:type III restriction enzyme
MQLKNYQKTAVDKLIKINKKLLEKEGQHICVFKAPTGSGKTIMIADFFEQLGIEHMQSQYAFIWISGNNLHKQSKEKLEQYLNASRYTFSFLEDIQGNEFKENEVVFVNWHSLTKQDKQTGEYTNIFMRDNEADKNLRTFITNTKEKGLEMILIVDESHYHYWSPKSQQLVQDVINPKLTLEVSATPKLTPSSEDLMNEEAGFVSVKFEDVIAEGMIKTEVVINKEIGTYTDFNKAADEVILSAALKQRQELVELNKKEEIDVSPLVLIQLPNESEKTSVEDKTKLEFTQKYLQEEHGISVENGKLGIWLSETKENIDDIVNNNSEVEVLIFKQAIALGWDCPRAQILVMFRDIKSTTFEIQTVGRIMRMPEAKHYINDDLNRAFVYTNLDKIEIAHDKESQSFFQINPAHRKGDYKKISLPSVYLSRIDYGDLTLKFRQLFISEANKYFGITEDDFANTAKEQADIKLDLSPNELTQSVISDAVIKRVDNAEDVIGKIVHFTVPEDDLKFKFEYFAKASSLPYAPVRSHTKIQQAIYDWFDDYLGYKDASRLEIQRIVVCSAKNQKVFRDIIEAAKERFKEVDKKDKQAKQVRKEIVWDVPPIDYFNELFEKNPAGKYAMDPCYLKKDHSQPEIEFEKEIASSKKIEWWYKNGENKEIYFAISYMHPKDNVLHAFYPDYIIVSKDGSVGIYDTKSGFTADSSETEAKSNALHEYIKSLQKKGRKIQGGVVVFKKSGLFVFGNANYKSNTDDKDWERIDI